MDETKKGFMQNIGDLSFKKIGDSDFEFSIKVLESFIVDLDFEEGNKSFENFLMMRNIRILLVEKSIVFP